MTRTQIIETRFARPSVRMRLGTWLIGKQQSEFKGADRLRDAVPNRTPPLDAPMPDAFERRFQVERWSAEGQDVVTLHPKAGRGIWHIIYFHGGGYYLPMFKEHWPLVAALVEATGASISVPLYHVVPEHDYRPANAQADAVYEAIKAEWGDDRIALCGDSAGGNMTVSLALQRRDAGKSLPARLIPFAPWLDMAMKDEAARTVEPHDVLLDIDSIRLLGEWWAGDRGVDHPHASPLYADLSGLPPMAIFQGMHDVFCIDARTFAAKAAAAGVPTRLYEYEGAPHVYMALTFTREAKDTFALIRDFLES
jgi:acetyl esterase/lipase